VTSNVVDVEPEAVRFGMAVEVFFEEQGGHWVPLFRHHSIIS
jgi:uncharacterized OB-fold protein